MKPGDRVRVTDKGSEHFDRVGQIDTVHGNDQPAEYAEVVFLSGRDSLPLRARLPVEMLTVE